MVKSAQKPPIPHYSQRANNTVRKPDQMIPASIFKPVSMHKKHRMLRSTYTSSDECIKTGSFKLPDIGNKGIEQEHAQINQIPSDENIQANAAVNLSNGQVPKATFKSF